MRSLSDIQAGGFASDVSAFKSGDVVGPPSATDIHLARFDETSGKLLQNSKARLTDNGDLSVGMQPVSYPGLQRLTWGGSLYECSGSLELYFASGYGAAGMAGTRTEGFSQLYLCNEADESEETFVLLAKSAELSWYTLLGKPLVFYNDSGEYARHTADGKLLVGTAVAGSELVRIAGAVASSGLRIGPEYTLVNHANCTLTADSITATTATFTASAYSSESYVGDVEVSATIAAGFVEFQNMALGLNSDPATNTLRTSLDYAFVAHGGTTAIIEESGTVIFYPAGALALGDRIGVRRVGTAIEYLRNGTVVWTTTGVSASTPLYLDTAFSSAGASFSDITFGPPGAVLVKVAGLVESNGLKFSDGSTQFTASSGDATLLARANHTGTQLAATISDFASAADARVSSGIAAHAALADPHPGYLTTAEGSASFQPLSGILTGTTASFTTAQETKLSGVAAGATVNSPDATLLARANHTGTQLAATISDFAEASQDVVGAMVAAAGGTYDDGAGTITLPGAGGGTTVTSGITTVQFGAFPGTSDASVTITGQAGIAAGSKVKAYLIAAATADHSADEHWLETLEVMAGNVVPGTGFTIYAKNTGTLSEPVVEQWATTRLAGPGTGINQIRLDIGGGKGTRLYGQWTVAWEWI